MKLDDWWTRVARVLSPGGGEVKCFERELLAAGGVASRVDLGMRTVPTAKIVGSVSRWNNLRGDFFEKNGPTMSERYLRIGTAMTRGSPLPALELYELRTSGTAERHDEVVSEYYVVDGHHRVAMARRLGVVYLDAHVVVYWSMQPRRDDGATPFAD